MKCQGMVLSRMNFLDNKSYTMAFSVGDVEEKKQFPNYGNWVSLNHAKWKLLLVT